MKVIKHGNTIKEMTCPKCFCIFEYSEKDIENHSTNYFDPMYDCFMPYTYSIINCPECCSHIKINEQY